MSRLRNTPAVGKLFPLGWLVLVSATIPQRFLPLSSGFSYYDSGEDVANGHGHGECLVQERFESRVSNGMCRRQQDCLESFSNAVAGNEPLFCDTSDPNSDNWPVCCRTQERVSELQCTRFSSITSYGTMLANGLKTTNSQMPFMVALRYNTTKGQMYLCGGTLISPRHVLTAAHCIVHEQGSSKGPVSVLAGDVLLRPSVGIPGAALRSQSPGRSERRVQRFHTPPEYIPGSYYNDIAVLELEAPFQVSKYIVPACLPSPSRLLFAEKQLLIAGWGITKKDHKGTRPNVLRHAEVQRLTMSECNAFGEAVRHIIPEGIRVTQFCAGDSAVGASGCSGDSGGPAVVKKVDRSGRQVHYVVGISSIGPSACATKGIPNVYTNVQAYLSWIESVVWP